MTVVEPSQYLYSTGEIEWHKSMRPVAYYLPAWLVKYKSSLRQDFEDFIQKEILHSQVADARYDRLICISRCLSKYHFI